MRRLRCVRIRASLILSALVFAVRPTHGLQEGEAGPRTQPVPKVVRPCAATRPIKQKVSPLAVELEDKSRELWELRRAEIHETLAGTEGQFEIATLLPHAPSNPVFYGEYFDDQGRWCFSRLFKTLRTGEQALVSSEQNESRTLWSFANNASPTTRPITLKLYYVGEESAAGSSETTSVPRHVYGLVGLNAGESWEHVWLSSELQGATGPILDLLLARVTVDVQGKLRRMEALNALSGAVDSWFSEFIAHQHFKPATRDGVPVSGTALILVRAMISTKGISDSAHLPRESFWVNDYVRTLTRTELPTIISVLLSPSSRDYYCHLPVPGYFEYDGIGSE